MKNPHNISTQFKTCLECQGRGKTSRRLRKKVKLAYEKALDQFTKSNNNGKAPVKPKGHLDKCLTCSGSGLIATDSSPIVDSKNYPQIAIIGGGIGGVALAIACLHRGIPFTLYERDNSFDARSQGYGLTLQQASTALQAFGISALKDGVVSTKHVVHTTDGKIIGEWGLRKWKKTEVLKFPKRTNIHIARQTLRSELLEQLGGQDIVQWGHQLIDFKENEVQGVTLNFIVDGKQKITKADLVVGADGIRSTVRDYLIGEDRTPLQYLGCIVILGICPLSALNGIESPLLDSATVFQTANGIERIYMMPFNKDSIMWQLSFPMSEIEAKLLSGQGVKALKKEACRRTQWHDPIPQIIAATQEKQISGYPVYDRELLTSEMLENGNLVTLIGDAAHPMSPFKGQGANQALIDALSLAREIYSGCRPQSHWRETGLKESVLKPFETEMISRSAPKVTASAEAAKFLHSEMVLLEDDSPRGRFFKKE